jgi:hypothetical protein
VVGELLGHSTPQTTTWLADRSSRPRRCLPLSRCSRGPTALITGGRSTGEPASQRHPSSHATPR